QESLLVKGKIPETVTRCSAKNQIDSICSHFNSDKENIGLTDNLYAVWTCTSRRQSVGFIYGLLCGIRSAGSFRDTKLIPFAPAAVVKLTNVCQIFRDLDGTFARSILLDAAAVSSS